MNSTAVITVPKLFHFRFQHFIFYEYVYSHVPPSAQCRSHSVLGLSVCVCICDHILH